MLVIGINQYGQYIGQHGISTGQRVELKMRMVVKALPGCTKRQTFYLYDLVRSGAAYTSIKAGSAVDKDHARLVELGHMTLRKAGKVYNQYAPVAVFTELNWEIIDWEK